MKKPQWITLAIAFLMVIGLYAATQKQFFGDRKRVAASHTEDDGHNHAPGEAGAAPTTLGVDSILFYAKQNLSPAQVSRLTELENGISRGDVRAQQLHNFHLLANFWKDTARVFAPFAWYTAEAARLENSEKSLTFAARLFLQGLKSEEDPAMKKWEAVQAKDLFERSLKINPDNDSSKVNLGAVYLYGGLASPMEGISKIREVVQKDSTNIHAQMTLGEASLISGQLDKAVERFNAVARMQPNNLEAIFALADTYERMGNKAAAVEWYGRSLPLIGNKPDFKKEVEARIVQLKK